MTRAEMIVALMRDEPVSLTITRGPWVVIPENVGDPDLEKKGIVNLIFDPVGTPYRIQNLVEAKDDAIEATLSFNGVECNCLIPTKSIMAIHFGNVVPETTPKLKSVF